MEKFKGTPGPWVADIRGGCAAIYPSCRYDDTPGCHRDDERNIAFSSKGAKYNGMHWEIDGSVEHDFNLMAAAPELLEALQDLESRACIYVNTSKANAAINKALGIDKMTPEQERDEALKILKEVLENYQYNGRKGIGMGPLVRASKLLDKYGMFKELGEKQ